MKLVDSRTGIEVLERHECLELLAADHVGRLAVIRGDEAMIFPVNYVLDGDSVVFRSAPGAKLDAAGRAGACFEVDGFDRDHHRGWSVVVAGRLEEITRYDGPVFDRLSFLGVKPWADGDKPHLMRLVPKRITGRRVP
jgi:nitroimidazol reductase NimA-like FMN-containing flavoprotein (pyridoxamine 5'-phosphate oxidase superfamily)